MFWLKVGMKALSDPRCTGSRHLAPSLDDPRPLGAGRAGESQTGKQGQLAISRNDLFHASDAVGTQLMTGVVQCATTVSGMSGRGRL